MGLLRFWLASMVVMFHSTPSFLGYFLHGGLAVQTFFIISGFFIQMVISEKYFHKTGPWIKNFYLSRALRIFPTYYLFLLCGFLLFPTHVKIFATHDLPLIVFYVFQNIFIFGMDVARFMSYDFTTHVFAFPLKVGTIPADIALSPFTLLPQAYSIDIELCFYLMAPFLLLRSTRFLTILMLSSILLRIILIHFGYDNDDWMKAFLPSEIATFLFGSLGYRFYKRYNSFVLSPIGRKMGMVFLGIIILWSLLYFRLPGPPTGANKYIFFLLFSAVAIPFIYGRNKDLKWDRFIGELSYPMYLSHFTIIHLMEKWGVAKQYVFFPTYILTIAVSVGSLIYFEKAITHYRHKHFLRQQQENTDFTALQPA